MKAEVSFLESKVNSRVVVDRLWEHPNDFAKQMKNLLNSKFTQNTFEDQNKEQFTRDRNRSWDSGPLSGEKPKRDNVEYYEEIEALGRFSKRYKLDARG